MPRVARMAFVGLTVVALAGLAGCVDPDAPELSEAEADRIAVAGMREFAAALDGGGAGDLRTFHFVATIASATRGEPSSVLTVDMEWGSGGVSTRDVVLEDGKDRHETTIWCTPGYAFYEWDGDVYQERDVRPSGRHGPCGMATLRDASDLLTPFTPDGAEGLPVPEVHIDGQEVTAVFHIREGHRVVVGHDAAGAVREVFVDAHRGVVEASATYGPRAVLQPPEPTERLPAHVEATREHDANTGRDTYEVVASWHQPPIGDIEARWVARDPVDNEQVVLASFPLAEHLGRKEAGFGFEDADNDGRVTVGDRYTFTAPAAEPGLAMRELILYDLWADRAVNESVPAPGALWLAVALGGLVGLVRRRG